MIIKEIRDEDFTSYKKPSMVIGFPHCSFKCEKECGISCCQNSELFQSPNIEITTQNIVRRYLSNQITEAVVMGGMEPLDSWISLYELIREFRKYTNDDIVVYTGFYKEEIIDKISLLREFPNIILKMGRFIPGQQPHYDEVLGIMLASDNQFAERIS